MVKLKEGTEIVINPDIFSKYSGEDPKAVISSRYSHIESQNKELSTEDFIAKAEALSNVKEFLIIQLHKNEESISQMMNDINTLRNLLRIEKSLSQKQHAKITEIESNLKEDRIRQEKEETESGDKISEIESKIREKQRRLEKLSDGFKRAKQQKKSLKEEVCRLMGLVQQMQDKNSREEEIIDEIASEWVSKIERMGGKERVHERDEEYRGSWTDGAN